MPRPFIYNIALIPSHPQQFIELSTQFSHDSNYILGDNSIAHITLAQFTAPPSYEIKKLWKNIQQIKKDFRLTYLELSLHETKAKPTSHSVWLQLQVFPNPVCQQLHQRVVALLNQAGIKCLNASLAHYDPHLTVAHTTDFTLQEKWQTLSIAMRDHFYVGLGKSDENWQIVKLLTPPPT